MSTPVLRRSISQAQAHVRLEKWCFTPWFRATNDGNSHAMVMLALLLVMLMYVGYVSITYGPHKAVAEVSNHNEPIGRRSGTQLVGKSMDFTFNCFVLN